MSPKVEKIERDNARIDKQLVLLESQIESQKDYEKNEQQTRAHLTQLEVCVAFCWKTNNDRL